MLLNRDSDKSTLEIRNGMGLRVLEMRFMQDEFLICLCDSITITKNDDASLYNELESIMDNNYCFSSPYSMKDNDTIVWTSDENYYIDNNKDRTNRLIIKKDHEKFHIYCSNPYCERNNICKQYGIIIFSPDENGQPTRNLTTNATFQNDMITLFRNVLNKNKVMQK